MFFSYMQRTRTECFALTEDFAKKHLEFGHSKDESPGHRMPIMEAIAAAFPLVLLVIIGILIFFLINEISKQQTSPRLKRVHPKESGKMQLPVQNRSSDTVLKDKLLSLVNGDQRTAQRLLTNCKRNNPGRSEAWYLDKVIYDLHRDRH